VLLLVLSLLLAASGVSTVWVLGGAAALAYVAIWLVLGLTGAPIGWALFGRTHVAGWVAGLLFGYAGISLAWSLVVSLHLASTAAFALAAAGVGALSWVVARRWPLPLVRLPVWHRTTSAAWLLVLLLVPTLVAPPFARLGSTDSVGNRQYRAYFIADFLWHTALTAELAKHEPKPRNPFLAPEPLHYYWTYFRVPATVAAQTGMGVEMVLKLNALLTAFLLVSAVYIAAWAALPTWPFATALAVALTIVAPSAEGLAVIADTIRRGLPLSELRNVNVDAAAAWAFKGLRIDNLPRTMWYTPQHGFSCALGLIAVPVALHAGAGVRLPAILLAGCALAGSLAFNPLLGAAFCLVYGVTALVTATATGSLVRHLLRHAVSIIPVTAAVAWCVWQEVGAGAGDALHIGFWGLARNATLVVFLLQFAPLLALMVPALWLDAGIPRSALTPALTGVLAATLLMHFVALTVDVAWVGFRAGNLFFVLAPAIAGRGLGGLWAAEYRRTAAATVAVVLGAGLPTTIVDAYNAQDVSNRRLSRDAERIRGTPVAFDPANEFHWTVLVTPAQQEALDWIRVHTPARAVVQMEPTIRGRETWSLIPSFAQRRMASGNPIALLVIPEYGARNERVRRIYASPDARAAWREAKSLGIDYLYVDATERAAYSAAGKFDLDREHFDPVFRNAEAGVYALRP
jgi:hypothetical protein